MELLLEAAKILKDEIPQLRFALIGDGAAMDEIGKRIADEHIENVIHIPFQPYDDIAHVFSLGDVGLIISKPNVGSNSVPSKTWSIMAAEKPLLASFDKESELCKIIEENDCGLVAAVKKMYNDREKAFLQGKNGKTFLMSEFDRDTCVKKYVETLEKVVK